jgi:PII-like signaling protein
MRPSNPARRLTIFVNETDRHRHRPLYTELVHRAHEAGLAGATVLRGIEGYGASSHIHTTRILSLSEDLPLVVVIVDEARKIEKFLPQLGELVDDKLVVMEEVRIVEYGGQR